MTRAQIRRPPEITHSLIKLIFISSRRRGAREPNGTILRGDPVESTGGGGGEAAPLVVNCGPVAAVDEVDEQGAGGSRGGVGEEAAVGVYIDGLGLSGVLCEKVGDQLCMDRGPLGERERERRL